MTSEPTPPQTEADLRSFLSGWRRRRRSEGGASGGRWTLGEGLCSYPSPPASSRPGTRHQTQPLAVIHLYGSEVGTFDPFWVCFHECFYQVIVRRHVVVVPVLCVAGCEPPSLPPFVALLVQTVRRVPDVG